MIDIVIPVRNRRDFLKRALKSVKRQSFSNWKVWIVDDGSRDGVLRDFYMNFKDDIRRGRMEMVTLPFSRGVSTARNEGIRRGRRELVALLDSDDEWLPNKLEKQIQFAGRFPSIPLIHCDEIWFRGGRILNQKKKHQKSGGRIFKNSVQLCCISPSSAMIRRRLFEDVGLFREDFPVCEDYEMWLRVTSRFSVGFVPEVLVRKHGGHSDQLSTRYRAMDYWRVKALYPYLNSSHISSEEKSCVRKTLREKCRILLKGYEKHANFKNREEVRRIFLSVEDLPQR